MDDIFEKLKALESGEPSNWKERVRYRRENTGWLRKSAIIALKVLDALRAQGLSQKDLADKMGVTPQQISKIVKGHENLTLDTIAKLESVLGIKIIVDDQDEDGNNSSAA